MTFPFPPPPPGYQLVLIVRGILIAWSLIGLGVLIWRMWNWKRIQKQESIVWLVAAMVSVVIAMFGFCRDRVYDNNDWTYTVATAAIAVSVAGVAIGSCRTYMADPIGFKKDFWDLPVSCGIMVVLAFLLLEQPYDSSSLGTHCRNNLKQLSLAMHNYLDKGGRFPNSVSDDTMVSWRVSLLPYIDQARLHHLYDQQRAWDQPPNDKLAFERVETFVCPRSYDKRDERGRLLSAYSMPTGPHTFGRTALTIPDIADGTSNTIMLVEACGARIVWTEPRDIDVSIQSAGINLNGSKRKESNGWISSYHGPGGMVAFADGRVRFIPSSIDPALLKKLVTVDGQEKLDADAELLDGLSEYPPRQPHASSPNVDFLRNR